MWQTHDYKMSQHTMHTLQKKHGKTPKTDRHEKTVAIKPTGKSRSVLALLARLRLILTDQNQLGRF